MILLENEIHKKSMEHDVKSKDECGIRYDIPKLSI
jgi:hypothetical protein